MSYRFALAALFLSAVAARAGDNNWPQFRGPDAGVSDNPNLPDTWDTTRNVEWSVPVAGRGWSSPVVWGNKIFLTTVTRKDEFETAKKGLYFGGERGKPPTDEHRWLVLCLDLATGKTLWEREASKGVPETPVHIKNSYASETPITDGERLYAYFGNKGLYCYDLDGKPLWDRPFSPAKTLFNWGTAASPVLHDGKLYVVNDNEDSSYLLCLDARTGRDLWKVDRDEKSNWATPYVWKHDGKAEIVTSGKKKVRSYDPDGKPLWEMTGMSSITIPTPFAKHGLLYVGSGYIMDQNRPLVAVKPGAAGDISLEKDATESAFVAWKQPKGGPYNPSFLVYGNDLYVLYDQGYLGCFDAKTGKQIYDRQRLSGQYTVSPWAYGGKVFCLNEDGETTVVRAGPKFEVLGKNKLDEMCMATPATAGDRLLIRTLTKLYCIKGKPTLGG
jgi:outer membrane protein assembly factor BamB